ncbi:hypothetical protein ABT215_42820 [Streptomyces sp900105755]|uniref:hypothetical protein n=1 Tax=Streptomyces sp. 900105755 TaxID=3154389 RepID=UPI003320B380
MVTEQAPVHSAGREGTPVLSGVTDDGSTQSGSLIDEIVREGACRMLAAGRKRKSTSAKVTSMDQRHAHRVVGLGAGAGAGVVRSLVTSARS